MPQKGSTYKRKASKRERAKSSPTFKDLDFMEMYPDGIYLSDSIYQSLENSIQRDCRVLETFKIMDYSLLIGIHNVDHASREDLASNNLTSNLTGGGISDGELDYFFLSCSSHIITISEFPHIVLTKKIQRNI